MSGSGWGWHQRTTYDGSNPRLPPPPPPVLQHKQYPPPSIPGAGAPLHWSYTQHPNPPPPMVAQQPDYGNEARMEHARRNINRQSESFPYRDAGQPENSHFRNQSSVQGYGQGPIPPPPPPAYMNPFQRHDSRRGPEMWHRSLSSASQHSQQQHNHWVQPDATAPHASGRQPALEKDDSSMDMSVDEKKPANEETNTTNTAAKTTAGDTPVPTSASDVLLAPVLEKRLHTYRKKHGDHATNTNHKLKVLALLAFCHDQRHYPENQHIFQEFVRLSNRRFSQASKNPKFQVVDDMVKSNGLLEIDANGYKWIYPKIEKALATIRNEEVDLDSILSSVTRSYQAKSRRNPPSQNGGIPNKILDLMQYFHENGSWPKNTSNLGKVLTSNRKFLLLPFDKKMKEQRNRVEGILKHWKFLELSGQNFVWKYGKINTALQLAGRNPVEIPSTANGKTKTPVHGLATLSEKVLHNMVVDLFQKFRDESWPLTVGELENSLQDSSITNLSGMDVATARKDIIRRILVPNDYVAWNSLAAGDSLDAVITWQMDAINAAYSRWQFKSFDEFTASAAFSALHKQVLVAFRSTFSHRGWPEDFAAWTRIFAEHGVLKDLSEQDLLRRILLPNGYMSRFEEDRVCCHFSRILLAIGRSNGVKEPFCGCRDELLSDVAKAIGSPHGDKTVAAAQACHNIFSIVDFWPENRKEMACFLQMKAHIAVETFINIKPDYEVAEKIQDVLEPLFCNAKLLVVEKTDPTTYSWSDNPRARRQSQAPEEAAAINIGLATTERICFEAHGARRGSTSSTRRIESSMTDLSKEKTNTRERKAQTVTVQDNTNGIKEERKVIYSKVNEAKLNLAKAKAKRDLVRAKQKLELTQKQKKETIVVQPQLSRKHVPVPEREKSNHLHDLGDNHASSADYFLERNFDGELQFDILPEVVSSMETGDNDDKTGSTTYSREEIEEINSTIQLLSKKQSEERQKLESFREELVQSDNALKSTSTEICAYDHRIPEMERDISAMKELVEGKLSELTRKRSALLREH